ncbi:MAG TPA: hypothetical protein K8V37_09765, partial [Enterococcus hirae]|nr:hypothetical protein [Enterococcus hirae]
YRITSDSRNIVLSKVRRDEEGNIRYNKAKEESRTDIGYYQTLSISWYTKTTTDRLYNHSWLCS